MAFGAPVARPRAASARRGARDGSEAPQGCRHAQVSRGWGWRAWGGVGEAIAHFFLHYCNFLLHARKIAAFSLQGFVAHFFFGCTFFFAATFLCPLHETGFRCTLFVSGWAHLEGGVVVFPFFFNVCGEMPAEHRTRVCHNRCGCGHGAMRAHSGVAANVDQESFRILTDVFGSPFEWMLHNYECSPASSQSTPS